MKNSYIFFLQTKIARGDICYLTKIYFFELLTKAIRLLSGDHELTLIVPCPPYM